MDTIADMLTIIRNAQAVKKDTVSIPYSKIKMDITELLAKEGFVKEAIKRGKKNKKTISVILKYDKESESAIREIKRISKPSKRIYLGVNQIRSKQGVQILTTPKGILTGKDARKQKVGGEIICEVK